MKHLSVRIALVCAALLAPAATAWASHGQTVSFEAPRDLLDASLRPAAMDQLASLGVRSLRVVIYWHSVAPSPDSATRPNVDATDPGAYDWGQYDALLAAAAQRNWSVLLTVSGPVPRWATAARTDTVTRPSPKEFQAFMTAVGRHYGGQVSTWGIWNEPNHPQFLGPQYLKGHRPESGRIYRQLFLAGWRGLRASGNGSDKILMGETAPRGSLHDVAPLAFLRQALCLNSSYRRVGRCSNLPADGYAHHAYTTRQGPFFRPSGHDDVTIGVLSRLTRALDRAAVAGAIHRGLPVYLTEFGIQSFPDTLLGVPLAQQPEYDAISEKLAYDDPRVASFSQYLLRDDLPGSGKARFGGFESGLEFADGRPKPSYAAFPVPLVATRSGSGVGLWGIARPATAASTVTLESASAKGAFHHLKSVRTDARGHWSTRSSYRSGERFRVVWTAPGGTAYTGPPIRAYRRP